MSPTSSLLLLLLCAASFAQSGKLGVGRTPTAEELHRRDISVAPNGAGLPSGSGTVAAGKEFFANRCARCHGSEGQGRESVALAGGQGSLANAKPLKTVGSYWPYATTIFDYVRRAMPFDKPATLGDDQVYSLTAYLLYLNHIIPADTVIDARSLPRIQMPNHAGFIPDSRPDIKSSGHPSLAPATKPIHRQ